MYKIAKRKLNKTKMVNHRAENKVKHQIGSLVFWNEDKFDDNQMVALITKFGMSPMEIVSENETEEAFGLKWAVWVWFKCPNGIVEKTRPSNLKQLICPD